VPAGAADPPPVHPPAGQRRYRPTSVPAAEALAPRNSPPLIDDWSDRPANDAAPPPIPPVGCTGRIDLPSYLRSHLRSGARPNPTAADPALPRSRNRRRPPAVAGPDPRRAL